jgi:hypothetical protein
MALSHAKTRREQFEEGCELYDALRSRRRRCGGSAEGFLTALGRLPHAVLLAFRVELQAYALRKGIDPSRIGRWQAFGLDGTKQNLPLTDENLDYYGSATKDPGRPQRLLAVAFGLAGRMVWDWEAGRGDGSERELVGEVSQRLPKDALVVVDAGMVGYEWVLRMIAAGKHLLMRVGANCTLLCGEEWHVDRRDGKVWLWPKSKRDGPPLVLRLIRVKCKCRTREEIAKGGKEIRKTEKREIWLLTDVMDRKELSVKEARGLYEMRWPANEVGFRVWKHVLNGEKAYSRTPEQAEREGMLSLLGMMWLQVLGAAAQQERRVPPRPVSVARAARVWRKAARHCAAGRNTLGFQKKMSEATIDPYQRRKPKVKRRWAERKDHNFATRPKLRRLTAGVKRLGLKMLEEQCA